MLSNANSGQSMFVVGKFCRDAKPRGYEGCKKKCIHIVPVTDFTLNSYPIAIFTYTLSFISIHVSQTYLKKLDSIQSTCMHLKILWV